MCTKIGQGRITNASLRKRLNAFYPNMPAKDVRFLMHNKVGIVIRSVMEANDENVEKGFGDGGWERDRGRHWYRKLI